MGYSGQELGSSSETQSSIPVYYKRKQTEGEKLQLAEASHTRGPREPMYVASKPHATGLGFPQPSSVPHLLINVTCFPHHYEQSNSLPLCGHISAGDRKLSQKQNSETHSFLYL